MTKKDMRDRKTLISRSMTYRRSERVKALAIMIVVIMVLPVVASSGMFTINIMGDSQDDSYDRFIRYHSNNGTDTTLDVGYSGIAATEYNPEFWSQSGVSGALSNSYSSWTGESYTLTGDQYTKTNLSITLAFWTLKDVQYKINMPDGTTIVELEQDGSNATSVSVGHDNKYFLFTRTNNTELVKFNVTVNSSLSSVKKVFAGWSLYPDDDEQNRHLTADIIYPGDVIQASTDRNNPTDLYARWVVPDLFVLEKDTYDLRGVGTDYTIDVISPYANLSTWTRSGSCNIIQYQLLEVVRLKYYEEDTVPEYSGTVNKGAYSEVIPGLDPYTGSIRTAPDMFGTIYHLDDEHTLYNGNRAYEYRMNINSMTLKQLPAGTYRSTTENSVMYFEQSGSSYLTGDVIIDNIRIDNEQHKNTHGSGASSSLYANGYKLIMGTGIENSGLDSSNPAVITTSSSQTHALQIFGGKESGDLTDVTASKRIVFSTDEDTNSSSEVDLGTFVIVHSGTYFNVVAGCLKGAVGTQQNPLSTYVVMKGGSTIDTLSGGCTMGTIWGTRDDSSGNVSRFTGGTFVYVIDHFTPGDDYEDKQSGWYSDEYGRNTYSILESSVIQGGCRTQINGANSVVHGSTHVFVSGNSSVWDVQAAGRSGYSETIRSYMEISGNAIIRHAACGTITDGTSSSLESAHDVEMHIRGNSLIANVFGAGYDTWEKPNGASMLSGSINVNVHDGTVGNVFGGGYRGSIGDGSLVVNVTIDGGTILNNVYGGGSGGVDKICHNTNGTFYSGNGYKASMGFSQIYGDVNVTVGGDAVVNGNVYGGGMAVPKLSSYSGIDVTFESEGWRTINSVKYEVAAIVGDVKVQIQDNAVIKGDVYGAGRGIGGTYSDLQTLDMAKIEVIGLNNGACSFSSIPWCLTADNGQYVASTYTYDSSLYGNVADTISEGCRYLNFAKVTGDCTVVIDMDTEYNNVSQSYVGVIEGNVYGGSAFGKVQGTTKVIVEKGKVLQDVYGGGMGRENINSISGERLVYIEGDNSIAAVLTGNEDNMSISGVTILGSVYGGSRSGDDGPINGNAASYVDANVVIRSGYIKSDVFGGGLLGKTFGSTNIYIGYVCDINQETGLYQISPYTVPENSQSIAAGNPGVTVSSVYAGGNVSTEYDENGLPQNVDPFTTYLVKGNGKIYVYGDGGRSNISITGSVMGSGNSCLTADTSISDFTTYIEFKSTTNKGTMTGIHRADNVLISQSDVKISGRNPLQLIDGVQKSVSIFNIGLLELENDSHVSVIEAMDSIANISSLDSNHIATPASSPSNEITFLTGSTFYIRSGSPMTYGTVTGNILLSVDTSAGYGAYVLGSNASTGGFVVMRDGYYVAADYSDNSNVRCWFISGTQKKSITMELSAVESEGNPVLTSIQQSVQIQKLKQDTVIKYVGGTFTPIASADYTFVKPGGSIQNGEPLGMLIGYKTELGEKTANTLYSSDLRLLDIGNGSEWMYGTYFTEDDEDTGITYVREGYPDNPSQVVKPLMPVELSGTNSTQSGEFSLNLVFSATHEARTTYIGYLTLNLQESTTVSYDVIDAESSSKKTTEMITNKIEIRVDLYIVVENDGTSYDFGIKMKTEEVDEKYQGQNEIMSPKGLTNGTFTMDSISFSDNFGDANKTGAEVLVSAVTNYDRTSGWSSTTGALRMTEGMSSTVLGTLIGSIPATLKIYLEDYVYQDYDPQSPPEFTISFHIDVPGSNEPYDYTVTVGLIKKTQLTVTFYDQFNGENTCQVYEGESINPADVPSTEPNFIGWYYYGTNFVNKYDMSTPVSKEGLKLEARYAYQITFDNGDGTTSQMYVPADTDGTALDKNSLPSPGTIAGFEFVGWCVDKDLTRLWDFTSDVITQDTTLYAKWSGKDVKILFWYRDANNELQSFEGYNTNPHERYVEPTTVGELTYYVAPEEASDYAQRNFYVMMTVTSGNSTQYVFPTVKYGSTFNTTDPWQTQKTGSTVNILDFAKSQVESKIEGSIFICWQAFRFGEEDNTSYNIYPETVLSGDIAKNSNGNILDAINLYAVTASVAVEVNMTDQTGDASVNIATPAERLVYPQEPSIYTGDLEPTKAVYSFNDGPQSGYHHVLYLIWNDKVYWYNNSNNYLNDGCWTYSSGDYNKIQNIKQRGVLLYMMSEGTNDSKDPEGQYCYYQDDDNNWYIVENGNYKSVYHINGNRYYGVDKFGNHYWRDKQFNNDGWTAEFSIVYAKDAQDQEQTYRYVGSDWYILTAEESTFTRSGESIEWTGTWESCDAPSSYYFKDNYGNQFIKETQSYDSAQYADSQSVTVYYESNGVTKSSKRTENYYLVYDGYGNYYTINFGGAGNNKFVIQYSIVYIDSGSETTYRIDADGQWYEYTGQDTPTISYDDTNNVNVWSGSWSPYNGDKSGYYYKDGAGNKYYGYFPFFHDLQYKITKGTDAYYKFSYQLNDATRSGYHLSGWYTDHTADHENIPGAGSTTTIEAFFTELGDERVICKEVFHSAGQEYVKNYMEADSRDTTNYSYVEINDFINCPRIDDSAKKYTINYSTTNNSTGDLWIRNNYTVSVGSMAHGTIHAYYVESNGDRTEFTTKSDVKYGDKIEIAYTPKNNYEFSKWFITGDYKIGSATAAATTLIVQGNVTISVTDIGERLVSLNIKFDNGRITDADKNDTTVFMRNVDTGTYYEMGYIEDSTKDYETYRGYVPIGNYNVYLRYNIGEVQFGNMTIDYGQKEYRLYGDLKVNATDPVQFRYYVLTARIVEQAKWDDGQTVVDTSNYTGFTKLKNIILVDNTNGNLAFMTSKYTGVLADYIDVDISNINFIINNPDNAIPPVYYTVYPGYTFYVYEGFPDNGMFNINDINVYPYGSTIDGNEYEGRFDLNWTRYDAPADVVIRSFQKASVTIDHQIANGGTQQQQAWSQQTTAYLGSSIITDIPSDILDGSELVGWFYDNGFQKAVMNGDVLGSSVMSKFGLDGKIALSETTIDQTTRYIDGFGRIYSSNDVDSLIESIVYKVENDVEYKYKITYSNGTPQNYYKYNNGNWDSHSAITLFYYKDVNGNKFAMDKSGNLRCFSIATNPTLYANVSSSSEFKTVDVHIQKENVNGGYDSSDLQFNLIKDGDNYTGTYDLDSIEGYSSTLVLEKTNGCTATQNDGTMNVSMTVPSNVVSAEFTIKINLIRTDLVWNKVWGSDPGESVQHDGWTYNGVSNKFEYSDAKYGQVITMPKMAEITGWSPSDNITDAGSGTFTYTVSNKDENVSSVSFNEVTGYIKVTFSTFKYEFKNGSQSITYTMPKGVSFNSYYDKEFNVRTELFTGLSTFESESNCSLSRFYYGDTTFSTTTGYVTDMAFMAEWNVQKISFQFNKEAGNDDCQVSAVESSNALSAGTQYEFEHNSEIIIYIKPAAGKLIDYEQTISSSTQNYDFGEPQKISDDKGYKWSFTLTRTASLTICFKDASANIHFFVNGVKYYPDDDNEKIDVVYNGSISSYGHDIPIHSVITSIESYGSGWFTNPECTDSFSQENYILTEDLSLYTYNTYIVMFHDYDGSSSRKYSVEPVNNTITLPNHSYAQSHMEEGNTYVFIGWAVKNNDSNVLTYTIGDTIPTSAFGATKKIDLYAYYLRDGSATFSYTGNEQTSGLTNIQGQTAPGNLATVYYRATETDEWSTDQIGITMPNTITVYYKVEVNISEGHTDTIEGTYKITIKPSTVYVFAPSMYKLYDGSELSASVEDVRYYTVVNYNIYEIYTTGTPSGMNVGFKQADGYGYSITNVGTVYTSITISFDDPAQNNQYQFTFIDGTLAVFKQDSHKFESWGLIS